MKLSNIVKAITKTKNKAKDPICGMRVDLGKTKY